MTAKTRAMPAATGQPVDLRIFLLVHRALRRDFGALAQAIGRADGPAPRDRALARYGRTALWRLEHHHHGEDARVWPLLRANAPEAAALLHALEAEHQHLDRLVADARRIKELRLARSLTLSDLATRLADVGMPYTLSTLSRIEQGKRRVDIDDLIAVALALGVSPNAILFPPDEHYEARTKLTPKLEADTVEVLRWAGAGDAGGLATST